MLDRGMRALALLALAAVALGAPDSPDADDYFEVGVDYVRKGFYAHARSAFAESLVRAPGQAVPLAFAAVASMAGGYSSMECALLVRRAYELLPPGKTLALDLRTLLPSALTLQLLEQDFSRVAAKRKDERPAALTVVAFLQVHNGEPGSAPAVDELLKLDADDAFALALKKRVDAAKKKAKKKSAASD